MQPPQKHKYVQSLKATGCGDIVQRERKEPSNTARYSSQPPFRKWMLERERWGDTPKHPPPPRPRALWLSTVSSPCTAPSSSLAPRVPLKTCLVLNDAPRFLGSRSNREPNKVPCPELRHSSRSCNPSAGKATLYPSPCSVRSPCASNSLAQQCPQP